MSYVTYISIKRCITIESSLRGPFLLSRIIRNEVKWQKGYARVRPSGNRRILGHHRRWAKLLASQVRASDSTLVPTQPWPGWQCPTSFARVTGSINRKYFKRGPLPSDAMTDFEPRALLPSLLQPLSGWLPRSVRFIRERAGLKSYLMLLYGGRRGRVDGLKTNHWRPTPVLLLSHLRKQ